MTTTDLHTDPKHVHRVATQYGLDSYHTGQMCRCGCVRIHTHSRHANGSSSWYSFRNSKKVTDATFGPDGHDDLWSRARESDRRRVRTR